MAAGFQHHRLAVLIVTLVVATVAVTACRRGSPVLDPSPKTPNPDATISGTVRGPEGTAAIAGRTVRAMNLDTGALFRAATNEAGGYTFKVPPGRYRVDVTLLAGESVAEQPDELNVGPADLEVTADFVLKATRLSQPRTRPLRMADGLGAPSA
jgi:hypothetical protein